MNHLSRRQLLKKTAALSGVLGWSGKSRQAFTQDAPAIGPRAISQLREKLQGRLVLPADSAYETARRVFYWNPRTERTPLLVVQCGHEEDVVRAVDFARRFDLEVAVRSGGHSHLGWGSSNGLVIDMSPLKRITVDPQRRMVWAQAGATSGEVARAAGRHGLAPVLGQCPGVSATGVTLGGGLGWLSGLYGACCDHLQSARLVTAAARTLDVNAQTHPDLFWGLCGAGANFGATTSFAARLQPVGQVLGGDIHFATRDAGVVLRGFRNLMHDAPDGFQATLNLTSAERGVFISLCHVGDGGERDQLLRQIRSLAKPTKEAVRVQPFAELAEKAAATNPGNAPPPQFRAIQTVYRDGITNDVIDILLDRLAHATPDVIMGLSHYMHGAVCRVEPAATAFPHRSAHSVHLRVAFNWSDPAASEQRFSWGEEWLRLLRPAAEERIYANYQTYETNVGAPSLFGQNYDRLRALKSEHDPSNFFRRNANVAPPKS